MLAALDGNPVQAMPYLAEALRLLPAGGDVFFRSLCLVCMVHFHGLSGDTSRADAACGELDAITAEMGAAALYYVHWARGWAAFCRGDWAEATRAYTAELSYPGPVAPARTSPRPSWPGRSCGPGRLTRRGSGRMSFSAPMTRPGPAPPCRWRSGP